MSLKFKLYAILQLFADGDGGDGGDGGAAPMGETSGAADRSNDYESRLRELGVPENKIRKAKGTAPVQSENVQAEPTQIATENAEAPIQAEAQPEAAKKLSWDEIMADPEYNQKMQEIVQNRVKKSKEAEDKLAKLAPALDNLSRKYNLDSNDIDELVKAVEADDSYYEDYALRMGLDVETAKKLDRAEKENARRQKQEAEAFERQKIVNHINKLESEANELKKVFPNFDLRTELNNPAFARMTSPQVGIPVQDAYYAVHRQEIQQASMQIAAQKTAQALSNNLQSRQNRPVENGGTQAASVTSFNYANASKAQREALKARIRRGEKIYPGRE